jgi:hypothetical protein
MRRITRKPERDLEASRVLVQRWGGGGALLAGVLFAAWGYIHRENAPAYLDAMARALNLIVPALFLVGLAGLYVLCERRAGRIGKVGFVPGMAGSAMGAAYAVPWSAFATRGDWLALLAWLDVVLVWWLHITLTGLLVIGVAAVRTRAVRSLGILMLAMGMFGWAYYLTDSGGIAEARFVHIGFGVLFSLSWVALGLTLLRESAPRFTK